MSTATTSAAPSNQVLSFTVATLLVQQVVRSWGWVDASIPRQVQRSPGAVADRSGLASPAVLDQQVNIAKGVFIPRTVRYAQLPPRPAGPRRP